MILPKHITAYQNSDASPETSRADVEKFLLKFNIKTFMWNRDRPDNSYLLFKYQNPNTPEPLLDEIKINALFGIHWAIVGGESGEGFRPFNEDWAERIRQACKTSNTAFFFKQVGGITSKAGGNKLHGKVYQEYPRIEAAVI